MGVSVGHCASKKNSVYIAPKIDPEPKTTIMVWACNAKGRDPHNKKYIEYDGDGNTTHEMA